MLDALFMTSWWIHSDAYTNCDPLSASYHYLNSSWDLNNETIHAARPRKCAHDPLHNGIAVSEGESSCTTHVPAHTHVDLPLEQEGHPEPLAVSAPTPAYEGATFSDTDMENNPILHLSLQDTTSWLLDTVAHTDFMNQPSNILEAPPSPIPAPMTLGDDGA